MPHLLTLVREYGVAVVQRVADHAKEATGDQIARRLFDSPRGDRLRMAAADLGEQPDSEALAEVLRAQLYAALEQDPRLASDLAVMVDPPRAAGAHITISHAQGVQIGNHNAQTNHFAGRPEEPRPRNMILVVSSNPLGTNGLRLDEEYRAIAHAVQTGHHHERLDVVSAPAARYFDIGPKIQQYQPVIVHFAGHGSETGDLILADDHGHPVDVPTSPLADMFGNHAATLRCVVLNGCFTKRLADAIAVHGPCVVGTSRAIPDTLAIEFTRGFYTAVANGRRFDEAFADGRNRIDLGDRAGSDAIVFVDRHRSQRGTAIA